MTNSSATTNPGLASFHQRLRNSRRVIRSLKAKEDKKRSTSEKLADDFSCIFGSIHFLLANLLWFAVWMTINLGLVPGIAPFDPFPFGLLTMIVSLEAIILAILVLISQNRAAKVYDLREEIDLQVDIIAEDELTKLMEINVLMAEKLGVDLSNDHLLKEMLKPINEDQIESVLEKEIENAA